MSGKRAVFHDLSRTQVRGLWALARLCAYETTKAADNERAWWSMNAIVEEASEGGSVDVKRHTMNSAFGDLEETDLVDSRTNPDDARQKQWALTVDGAQMLRHNALTCSQVFDFGRDCEADARRLVAGRDAGNMSGGEA
jgi:DNA-binding MarR family transcriptional regulator